MSLEQFLLTVAAGVVTVLLWGSIQKVSSGAWRSRTWHQLRMRRSKAVPVPWEKVSMALRLLGSRGPRQSVREAEIAGLRVRVEGRIQHSGNPHLRRVVFVVAASEVGPFFFRCSLHPYGHADLGFDALDAFSAVVEGTVERAAFTEEGSAICLRDCHLVSYSLLPPPQRPDAGGEQIAG